MCPCCVRALEDSIGEFIRIASTFDTLRDCNDFPHHPSSLTSWIYTDFFSSSPSLAFANLPPCTDSTEIGAPMRNNFRVNSLTNFLHSSHTTILYSPYAFGTNVTAYIPCDIARLGHNLIHDHMRDISMVLTMVSLLMHH